MLQHLLNIKKALSFILSLKTHLIINLLTLKWPMLSLYILYKYVTCSTKPYLQYHPSKQPYIDKMVSLHKHRRIFFSRFGTLQSFLQLHRRVNKIENCYSVELSVPFNGEIVIDVIERKCDKNNKGNLNRRCDKDGNLNRSCGCMNGKEFIDCGCMKGREFIDCGCMDGLDSDNGNLNRSCGCMNGVNSDNGKCDKDGKKIIDCGCTNKLYSGNGKCDNGFVQVDKGIVKSGNVNGKDGKQFIDCESSKDKKFMFENKFTDIENTTTSNSNIIDEILLEEPFKEIPFEVGDIEEKRSGNSKNLKDIKERCIGDLEKSCNRGMNNSYKDPKDSEDTKDVKDIKDIKDIKDFEDIKDIKDVKDIKDCYRSNTSCNIHNGTSSSHNYKDPTLSTNSTQYTKDTNNACKSANNYKEAYSTQNINMNYEDINTNDTNSIQDTSNTKDTNSIQDTSNTNTNNTNTQNTNNTKDTSNTNTKNVLLVHGFNGSSNSKYIIGLSTHFHNLNYRVFCFNARGTKNRLKNEIFFHIGWTVDIKVACDYILNTYEGTLELYGFSMGASWVTKYLGETNLNSRIIKGGAICLPFDFYKIELEMKKTIKLRLINRLLTYNYFRYIRRNKEIFEKHVNLNLILKCKNLRDVDKLLTKKIFKFDNISNYYKTQSCVNYIKDVKIPFLILNSKDDPIIPENVIDKIVCKMNKNVLLIINSWGGHLGFLMDSMSKSVADEIIVEFSMFFE